MKCFFFIIMISVYDDTADTICQETSQKGKKIFFFFAVLESDWLFKCLMLDWICILLLTGQDVYF